MYKPGKIIYSEPGFAIMAVGNDEYIFGDKVKKVPAKVIDDIVSSSLPTPIALGYAFGMEASKGERVFDRLDKLEAIGFALASTDLSTTEDFWKFWTILQHSGLPNLFLVHPYVQRLSVAATVDTVSFTSECERTKRRLLEKVHKL